MILHEDAVCRRCTLNPCCRGKPTFFLHLLFFVKREMQYVKHYKNRHIIHMYTSDLKFIHRMLVSSANVALVPYCKARKLRQRFEASVLVRRIAARHLHTWRSCFDCSMLLFDNRIDVFIKMSKVFFEVEKQQVAVGKKWIAKPVEKRGGSLCTTYIRKIWRAYVII